MKINFKLEISSKFSIFVTLVNKSDDNNARVVNILTPYFLVRKHEHTILKLMTKVGLLT